MHGIMSLNTYIYRHTSDPMRKSPVNSCLKCIHELHDDCTYSAPALSYNNTLPNYKKTEQDVPPSILIWNATSAVLASNKF